MGAIPMALSSRDAAACGLRLTGLRMRGSDAARLIVAFLGFRVSLAIAGRSGFPASVAARIGAC